MLCVLCAVHGSHLREAPEQGASDAAGAGPVAGLRGAAERHPRPHAGHAAGPHPPRTHRRHRRPSPPPRHHHRAPPLPLLSCCAPCCCCCACCFDALLKSKAAGCCMSCQHHDKAVQALRVLLSFRHASNRGSHLWTQLACTSKAMRLAIKYWGRSPAGN